MRINQNCPGIEKLLVAYINVAAKTYITGNIDIATIISFHLFSNLVQPDQRTG